MQKAVFRVTARWRETVPSATLMPASQVSTQSHCWQRRVGAAPTIRCCHTHSHMTHVQAQHRKRLRRGREATQFCYTKNHLSSAHTEPFFLSLFCPPCQEEEVFWPFSIGGCLPLPTKPHAIVNGHTQKPDNDDDDGTN